MMTTTAGMGSTSSIVVEQLKGLLLHEKRYLVPNYLDVVVCSEEPKSSDESDDDGDDQYAKSRNCMIQNKSSGSLSCANMDCSHDDDGQDEKTMLSDFRKQRIHWREKICEWCYQVVDHFDLNRECVYVAMYYVDRFSSSLDFVALQDSSKDDYQLLSMASLSLALKLFEHRNILVPGADSTLETILLLSRGKFVLKQLEEMELEILVRLEWICHPPTPQVFVKYILAAYFPSTSCAALRDMSIFCVELAVLDYFFVSYNPSEVAFSALLIAVTQLISSSMPNTLLPDAIDAVRALHSKLENLTNDRVMACHDRLEQLYSSSVGHNAGIDQQCDNLSGNEDRSYSPVSVSDFDNATQSRPAS